MSAQKILTQALDLYFSGPEAGAGPPARSSPSS